MRTALASAFVVMLVPWSADAQPVEISGGVDLVLPQPSLTYETRYAPRVQYITDFSGEAGQTLTLHRKRQPPLWGAIAWFPSAHVGLEGRVRYRSGPLEGSSGAHRLSLTYTSRQPPDYLPRSHTITRSDTQRDPGGEMQELSVSVLGVCRLGAPRRLQVRLAGGIAFLSEDGEISGITFAHYQMGGHSTLSGSDHRVTLDMERTWGAGAIATFDVHRALTPHVGILAGGHWLLPETFEIPLRVGAVEQAGLPPPVEYVQDTLKPAPLRFRPWTADLTVGLRFSF